MDSATVIPYGQIPHFPVSTAIGHTGELVIGTAEGVPVAVMAGRVHLYEGYTVEQVVFPIRVLARMGVNTLIMTNAAGSVNVNYKPGELMIISDHINFMGVNPLIGPNEDALGLRFFDMTEPYDPKLGELAEKACSKVGMIVRRGVYIAFTGPSYETPAEIKMARAMGADAVGMSTVPEVHRRPPHGRARPGHLVHHEHGGGRPEEEARPPRGAGHGGEGARRPDRRPHAAHPGRGEAGMKARRRRPPAAGQTATLVELARDARKQAHAPYSKFKVGAALLASSGEIVTGCNIENASYGLTLCAERVAVFKAVSEGILGFQAIAVVVDSPRETAPCGACRQVLWELCGDIWVHLKRLAPPHPQPADVGAAAAAVRRAEPLAGIFVPERIHFTSAPDLMRQGPYSCNPNPAEMKTAICSRVTGAAGQ